MLVEVKVGKGKAVTSYQLHKDLLSFYSGFFAAALRDNFKEGKEGIVKLPEEKPAVFERFVGWLYTHKINLTDTKENVPRYAEIFDLWKLADRREIPLLMNECMDVARDELVRVWSLPLDSLRNVYNTTTTESAWRRFMVHIICRTAGTSTIEGQEARKELFEDVLFDIMSALFRHREAGLTKLASKAEMQAMDMCDFHSHEEGVRCQSDDPFRFARYSGSPTPPSS